jgi:site-specific DNA-methyltransferase (adenine-specific)
MKKQLIFLKFFIFKMTDLAGEFLHVMRSQQTVEWSTPQDFYDELIKKYYFTLGVASTHEKAKCEKHYTLEEDGLKQPWNPPNYDENTKGTVWCNPPYGRKIHHWIKKAIDCKNKVVMLAPVRTSTPEFHDLILPNAKITFIRGRLTFGGYTNTAPYESMLLEFN